MKSTKNIMHKREYIQPTIEILDTNDADMLCISNINVKGTNYDDETMTDLSRRASFWGDEDIEE